ncbi:MAG: alpha/beta hydrolase [Pseudomonadota bacterium]
MLLTIVLLAGSGALLFLAWLARSMAERREARRDPPGEWVQVDGKRIHVRRAGSGGPTIVFEAGGAFSSAMWWPLQDRLAGLATVACYDRAGLGWSEPADLPRTIEQRADELGKVLQAAQLPAPYVLVGLSYGGPLIRVFAARHPELVAGLVFVDAAHEAAFASPGAQTYLKRSAGMLRFIAALASVGVPRLLRMRGTSQPATALPFTDAQRAALESRFPPAASFRTGADEFTSMLRIAEVTRGLDARGSLGTRPVCVLSHGMPFPGPFAVLEHNHMRGQQELAALSERGEVVVAEHSSHAIPLQEPGLVLEAVQRVWRAASTSLNTAGSEPRP